MYNSRNHILVCCHKKDIMATIEPYFPIQLGKEISNSDLGIATDCTGDNISYKNPSFCELTGIYWAWKNLKDTEVIGLCHYRRYFDFHGICQHFKPYTVYPTSSFSNINLSIPTKIINDAKEGTIILPREENYPTSVLAQFNNRHSSLDIEVIKDIIKNDFGDNYSRAFRKVLVLNNKLSLCNMFIMNWANFDNYCTWLFHILNKAETTIDISNYSPYQRRLFGFIAERLLNVWVYAEKKKIKRYPMIFFSEQQDKLSVIPSWKYGIGCYLNNAMNFIRKVELKLNLTP
jgi:hypothetical protein